MIDEAKIAQHVGRTETRIDIADPERLQRLSALLDQPWTVESGMPPLGHFVLFRPDERQSRLGDDGHPLREPSGMLPAVDLPRRMWAGSRIRFEAELAPGAALVRTSRLASATPKSGKSGAMVFCTVVHEIRMQKSGVLLIQEEQDIVYREAHRSPDLAPRPEVKPSFTPEHVRSLQVDPVMLFRYSALTFNSHRIHYDRDYARTEEGYSGLVVHGPYLATLLFEHLARCTPGRRIATFDFRAISPSFDLEMLTFGATIVGDSAELSVTSPCGLALSGKAQLA